MPNWCDCDLEVDGDEESVALFEKVATGGKGHDGEVIPITLDNLFPMPKELVKTRSPAPSLFDLLYPEQAGKGRMKAKEMLAYDWVKEAGVTTTEGLIELIKKKEPEVEADCAKRLENIERFGHGDWYSWCIANWGTKWGLCEPRLDNSFCADLGYGFSTAWAPPLAAFDKIARDWARLKFTLRYFESGMGFNGVVVWKDGERIVDESGDYFGNRGG